MKIEERYEALAFLGELGRSLAFAFFLATPVWLLELARALFARLR